MNQNKTKHREIRDRVDDADYTYVETAGNGRKKKTKRNGTAMGIWEICSPLGLIMLITDPITVTKTDICMLHC